MPAAGLAKAHKLLGAVEADAFAAMTELLHFAEHAAREPDRVLTAPYKLDRDSNYRDQWPSRTTRGCGCSTTGWARAYARTPRRRDDLRLGDVHAAGGRPDLQRFGFGLVYLPRKLIRGFVKAAISKPLEMCRSRCGTTNQVRRDVPICWHVRPVHPHVDPPTFAPRTPKRKG